MMISPKSLIFLFFWFIIMMNPSAMSGKEIVEISYENPKIAIIHDVTVVPILAPMMTPMACANVRSPAFTKLTTIIVVAVEDWMAAVTPTPVRRRLKPLEVMDARKDRRPSPATF